jgi:ribonuclease J
MREGMLISGPDIVSRGFVYVKESQDLVERTRKVAEDAIESALERKSRDFAELKKAMRDEVAKFIYKETKRKPMVLPIIMDV